MSPLRSYLTYNGEPLVSLDLNNSQPMHILFLLKPDFWYKTESPRTLHKLNSDLYKTGAISEILMFLQKPETHASIEFPFANFELLVQTGKLYKFIANHFAGHFMLKNGFDRFDSLNKAKVEMLRIMYFDSRKAAVQFYKSFKRFEQIFPTVAKIITALKSRRYQDFPILLQSLEAQIILKEIALTVSKELPEAPLFTIHDSILTTEKYRAQVKQIMIEIYRKHLGFTRQ
jgi:hypothetical protein